MQHWYQRTALSYALLPLAGIYRAVGTLRKQWLLRIKGACQLPVPVIVVGNISVGGTGKTPLVIWLVALLQTAGYRVGIVSRGYKGKAAVFPQSVTATADPAIVGDEPLLLALRTHCPVIVDPDRVAAARYLLEHYDCTVIVSDDGLQHYRLGRTMEIAVIDGQRQLGNGWSLPAGPLREPESRLQEVDFIVCNGGDWPSSYHMQLVPTAFVKLQNPNLQVAVNYFSGQTVHAVAGIGHPPRFFDTLRALGIQVIEHAFPDHHRYTAQQLDFADTLPIVMTEKDAVKCKKLILINPNLWYLTITAELPSVLGEQLLTQLALSFENKESNRRS